MTNCLDANARGTAQLLLPALPQLCQRLRAVDDLDLAEQCMSCLRLLAGENPRAVFEAGGLEACTRFFDFFPAHVQVGVYVWDIEMERFFEPSPNHAFIPSFRPSTHNTNTAPGPERVRGHVRGRGGPAAGGRPAAPAGRALPHQVPGAGG